MCRNIRPLYHFDPPATDEEIRAAALQFVRKISGFNKPSKANEAVFQAAVEAITAASRTLLDSLETTAHGESKAPRRSRAAEAAKAAARSARRFPQQVERREAEA